MEEVFEAVLVGAIILISIIAKNKNARKKAMSRTLVSMMQEKKKDTQQLGTSQPAKEADAETENTTSVAEVVLHAAPAAKPEEKPAEKPDHVHEGKDPSCPKDQPLISLLDAQKQKNKPAVAAIPGLNIAFDRQNVVQGVIMSEVLTRPAFKNGRRVIR